MKDWLETIDDYLKMTRRDILTSSGHINHIQAIKKLMQNIINTRIVLKISSLLLRRILLKVLAYWNI